MYRQHAVAMHLDQFNVDRHLVAGQHVAIVTISAERTYLRLASTGEALWVNGRWRRGTIEPDFAIGHNEDLPLALYYDCDSEGPAACEKIQAKNGATLPPRTLVPINQPVSTLLRPDGYVDRERLNAFILDHFGVPAHAP
jgi:hypothetical protein